MDRDREYERERERERGGDSGSRDSRADGRSLQSPPRGRELGRDRAGDEWGEGRDWGWEGSGGRGRDVRSGDEAWPADPHAAFERREGSHASEAMFDAEVLARGGRREERRDIRERRDDRERRDPRGDDRERREARLEDRREEAREDRREEAREGAVSDLDRVRDRWGGGGAETAPAAGTPN